MRTPKVSIALEIVQVSTVRSRARSSGESEGNFSMFNGFQQRCSHTETPLNRLAAGTLLNFRRNSEQHEIPSRHDFRSGLASTLRNSSARYTDVVAAQPFRFPPEARTPRSFHSLIAARYFTEVTNRP